MRRTNRTRPIEETRKTCTLEKQQRRGIVTCPLTRTPSCPCSQDDDPRGSPLSLVRPVHAHVLIIVKFQRSAPLRILKLCGIGMLDSSCTKVGFTLRTCRAPDRKVLRSPGPHPISSTSSSRSKPPENILQLDQDSVALYHGNSTLARARSSTHPVYTNINHQYFRLRAYSKLAEVICA